MINDNNTVCNDGTPEVTKVTGDVVPEQIIFDVVKSFRVRGDDTLFIYGRISDPGIDRDGEIVDQASLQTCFDEYMATNPVVKSEHSGGGIGMVIRERGEYRTAYPNIVVQVGKSSGVCEGAVTGFSVGINAYKRGNILYTDKLNEISLVREPSNYSAEFTAVDGCPTGITKSKEDENIMAEDVKETLTATDVMNIVKSALGEFKDAEKVANEAAAKDAAHIELVEKSAGLETRVAELEAELEKVKATKTVNKSTEDGDNVNTNAKSADPPTLIRSIMQRHYGGE